MTARRWRLLTDWGGEAGYHMGLDEALLLGDAPPTLRFYTWEPAALSLGYFQSWADVPATARVGSVVRRLTGGGAIHHADELTFSLVTTADDPLYRGPVPESYVRIHDALAEAFRPLGVDASRRGQERLSSERADTGMCFHVSSAEDLVWDGAKGVGSAQRRTGGRVLHHGSIKLGGTDLEPGIARLRDHAPWLGAEELAGRIAEVFAARFGLELVPGEARPEELEEARRRAERFRSEAFLKRR